MCVCMCICVSMVGALLHPGHWELWAHSACPEMIPVLKTTILLKQQ